MKIYTKTGDKGETSLYGGKRVKKSDQLIELIGSLDELNSFLGLAALTKTKRIAKFIKNIQSVLFDVGACVSGYVASDFDTKLTKFVAEIEQEIDYLDSKNKSLKNFILPGGCIESVHLHVCRSVCRRVERLAVSVSNKDRTVQRILELLNRLSDYFFVCARYENMQRKVMDVAWIKGAISWQA